MKLVEKLRVKIPIRMTRVRNAAEDIVEEKTEIKSEIEQKKAI